MEAMILEIMQENAEVTIIPSNDSLESVQWMVWVTVVHSFNINWKERTMTNLSIFTLSRNNLKDLQLFILKMISGAQGG